MDSWCQTVGPAVVLSPSSPASVSPQLENAFVVVTWNMNVGHGDIDRMLADVKAARLAGASAHFALLIQEARRDGPGVPDLPPDAYVPRRLGNGRRDIESIARTLNLHLAYAPAMRNGPGREDRGNAILSTLPLRDVTVIELPFERQRRIAIGATVHATLSDGTMRVIRLVSVHLETRVGALRQGPGAARRRQAEFLVRALGGSSPPTIVAGDFNSSWGDDEPAIETLRRAYPDAPRVRGGTWGLGFGISAKLDHVFARLPDTRVEVTRIASRYGSDHSPLVAVLRPR